MCKKEIRWFAEISYFLGLHGFDDFGIQASSLRTNKEIISYHKKHSASIYQ